MTRKKIFNIVALVALVLAVGVSTTACGSTPANVAAKNLSKEAEFFKIPRRIVFINTWTDKYLFQVTGYCSVETTNSSLAGSLEVTCKTGNGPDGKGQYTKAFLGLTRGVTYVVQQLNPVEVPTNHYEVTFRPGTLVPSFITK